MSVSFYIGLVLVIFCGLDYFLFFVMGLSKLPTSFTEWWCYPFWWLKFLIPCLDDGFGMGTASIIRIIELLLIVLGVVLMMLN